MFLVDSSRRGGKNFYSLVDFSTSVIRKFPFGMDRTRIGISAYSDRPYLNSYLDGHKSQDGLFDAMSSMYTTSGAPNYYIALWMAYSDMFTRGHGDRPDVPNVALLITDTAPDEDVVDGLRRSMVTMGKNVQDAKIGLYIIAVGDDVDLDLLVEISGNKDNVYHVNNYDTLLSSNTIEYVVYRTKRLGRFIIYSIHTFVYHI